MKTLAHKLGHICAGHHDSTASRARREVEAESVAFVVITAHEGSTDGYTLPYVTTWAPDEVPRWSRRW